MSNRTCLYEVLNSNGKINVTQDSGQGEIKKAFKVLAMKYHPDRVHDKPEAEQKEAAARFSEVQYAYGILSDDATRKMYDAGGFDALDEAEESGEGNRYDFSHMDIDDVLKDIDKIEVRENSIAVKRKGAKSSAISKFSRRNKAADDTAEAKSEAPAEAKPEPTQKPAGKVVMDTALRDEFAAFARSHGDEALAAKLEALEVVYGNKPGARGPVC